MVVKKNREMSKRINYVMDRFETSLEKLESGETDLVFLSTLKAAIDYAVRLYPDVGRLQYQRKLSIGVVNESEEPKADRA